MPEIDTAFTDLPLRRLADAALSRARALGVEHADIRVERVRDSHLSLHDARLDGTRDGEDVGFAVRVLRDGSWGFASHVDLTPESAERVAEQAVEVAKVSRPLSTQRIELADEPAYGDVSWVSPYQVDPFSIPDSDKVSLLADWSSALLAHDIVAHTDASVHSVMENKFYSDLTGTTTTQQRVRINCELEAIGIDRSPGGSTRCARWPPRPDAVGSTSPEPATTGPPTSKSCPSTWPRSCARRRWRAATTTL